MSFLDPVKRFFGGSSSGSGTPHPEAISCEEALRLVQDFLDGELDDAPSGSVREHFEKCQRCYPFLRMEESFRLALHKAARGESAPPDLRDRVLEVLDEAASDQQ